MYKYDGIKERFEQLKKANDYIKFRGLKSLDRVITLEIADAETQEQVKILLTYRRKVRLSLKKLVKGERATLKALDIN